MPSAPTSATAPGSEPFRLPRTIEPEIYHIEIEPDIASATFSGTVRIDAIVHETADQIVLNAAELAISDVEVLTVRRDHGAVQRELQRRARAGDLPAGRPAPPGTQHHQLPVQRDPQRQAAGLLPVHLHRSRRREPHHGDDPVRVRGRHGAPSPVSTSPTAKRSSRSPSLSRRAWTQSRTRPSSRSTGSTGSSASGSPRP